MKKLHKILIGAVIFLAASFMAVPTATAEWCGLFSFSCVMPTALVCADNMDSALDFFEIVDHLFCP